MWGTGHLGVGFAVSLGFSNSGFNSIVSYVNTGLNSNATIGMASVGKGLKVSPPSGCPVGGMKCQVGFKHAEGETVRDTAVLQPFLPSLDSNAILEQL